MSVYNTLMCGIAGIIGPAVLENKEALTKLCDGLAHRGPDAHGLWIDETNHIALAHTRLSIIDLNDTANQPFIDPTGNYVLTFNGEIYNYKTLRAELESTGVIFRTQSDTEVLLESYKRWGPDCVKKLEGMFAFAIWDAKQKSLFAARDRLGKKPFFYAVLENGLAFASEPHVLLELSNFKKSLHLTAMRAFLLLGYSPGTQTLWKDIFRLPAAHALLVQNGRSKIWRYWNLLESFENKINITEQDAAAHINTLLDAATETRLQSDVPFGLFLSGGLDSSAVLASMASKIGGDTIRTFSIGFNDPRYNESETAAKTAAHFGTKHKTFTLDPDTLDFAKILAHATNDPLADASFIPTYELSRLSRQSVKMILSGDGGDELFAGYPTYIASALHKKLSPFVPFPLPLPAPKTRRSFYYNFYQFAQGLPRDARRAHFSWRVFTSVKNWKKTFTPEFLENFSFDEIYALFEPHYEDSKHLEPLDQALYVDTKTWLVDSVLVKMDRATMSNGLEARAPLLDHRMVEFAASLPPSMKLKKLKRKYHMKHILREAQRSRLPEFLFNEPKRGFSVPISAWMRECDDLQDLTRAALRTTPIERFFNLKALESLMDQHENANHDNGLQLFNILLLSRFLAHNF